MVVTKQRSRGRRHRPAVEGLEPRCLLAAAAFHETLDAALGLGSLDPGARVQAAGTLGAGPAGAADVNWYRFHLSGTEAVHITALRRGSPVPLAALSLYNDAPLTRADPFDPTSVIDPYTATTHRLIAQDDPGPLGGGAVIDRLLGPGDYWVAVSGIGNDLFHPLLAGSGLPGRTGPYRLSITTSDPGTDFTDPSVPVVLAADPAPGATLSHSPFVFRFDLNTAIDPTIISDVSGDPWATAQLFVSPTNDFSPTGGATQVDLSPTVSLEPGANELLLAPNAPLGSGYYQLTLQGFGPGGSDYVLPFQVTGPVGNTDPIQQPGATPGAAHDIPNLTVGQLRQLAGAIGTDPTDPSGFNPSAVEFYHFAVAGPGTYGLDAEVFASRIGSPLDAALTLFRDDGHGGLRPVASNDNTRDESASADGRLTPLYTDPAIFASLTAGNYYLAVSSGENLPDPSNPNTIGVFDPRIPQSGSDGNSTGPYVLNVLLRRPGPAPHVVAVTPDTGAAGNGPLTAVRVRFDQRVNVQQLQFEALRQTHWGDGTLSAVRLTGADGTAAHLRFESYDDATNTATFVLLGAVPAGQYTLRLSGGAGGLAGFAGAPLAGNVAGTSDFVTHFVVSGAQAGGSHFHAQPGNDDPAHAQNLGVLFPEQLCYTVTVGRGSDSGVNDHQDDFRFQVLQTRLYFLTLTGPTLPPGIGFSLLDATGATVASYTYNPRQPALLFNLPAGTYTLRVTWPAGDAIYEVGISLAGAAENPSSEVSGPGSPLRYQFVTDVPPPPAPPPLLMPPAGSPDTFPVVAPAASSSSAPVMAADAVALPSGALLAKTFSPLQGVPPAGGDTAAGADHFVIRTPAPSTSAAGLVGLLIATQPPLGDDFGPVTPDRGASSEPPAVTTGAPPVTVGNVVRLLDGCFVAWGRMHDSARAAATATPAVPADDNETTTVLAEASRPGPTADEDALGIAEASAVGQQAPWTWGCALTLAALLACERLRPLKPSDEKALADMNVALPRT